jgi:hypothetical protein
MPDQTVTPGIRPGQIWQEIHKRKGKPGLRRFEVTGLGLGDVYGHMLNEAGDAVGQNRSLPRVTFEQHYRLVSEGGEPT